MKIESYKIWLFLLFIVLLSGCANSYKAVKFDSIGYNVNPATDSVLISYNTHPMVDSSNLRYQRYINDRNSTIIALKIKNNTSQPIIISKSNLSVTDGLNNVPLADMSPVVMTIHQPGWVYILWSLLFVNFTQTEENSYGEATSSSIPIPVGAVIGLTNVAKSKSADKGFHEQMIKNDLLGKTVEVNQELNGFLCIYGGYKNNLVFKYIR